MTENVLARVFEHNNWANLKIVEACAILTDEQLDAPPQSATEGSIRNTLLHLVSAQYGYLRLLTLPVDERRDRLRTFAEDELLERIGEPLGVGVLALAGLAVAPVVRTIGVQDALDRQVEVGMGEGQPGETRGGDGHAVVAIRAGGGDHGDAACEPGQYVSVFVSIDHWLRSRLPMPASDG